MELIPEWAPNIHPLLVHFPIAILALAVFASLIELLYFKEWISKSRLWLFILGSVSAIATVLSGKEAADSVSPPFSAEMTLSKHSDSAYLTLWYFLAFTLIQIFLPKIVKTDKIWVRIGLFVLASIGFYFLITTGDLGAKLVYKYGVGAP
jgi:uncharacterized membrane protein